jgi:hypothetical protein
MVTKTGVKFNKAIVGIASYRRSFMIKQSGWAGPECKFTESSAKSDAEPGKCIKTSGASCGISCARLIAANTFAHCRISRTLKSVTISLRAPTTVAA